MPEEPRELNYKQIPVPDLSFTIGGHPGLPGQFGDPCITSAPVLSGFQKAVPAPPPGSPNFLATLPTGTFPGAFPRFFPRAFHFDAGESEK